MNNITKKEINELIGKLYQYKNNKWLITGYKCCFCERHFYSLRDETYDHIFKCKGKKKSKRSLED